MSARNCPETTVLERSVFKRKPEAGDILRLSVKKRAVLMAGDFAANSRLLEDVHSLEQQRSLDAEVGNQLFDVRRS